ARLLLECMFQLELALHEHRGEEADDDAGCDVGEAEGRGLDGRPLLEGNAEQDRERREAGGHNEAPYAASPIPNEKARHPSPCGVSRLECYRFGVQGRLSICRSFRWRSARPRSA